jgi:hypothetical protein
MNEFVMMPVPVSKFAAVCALLAGSAATAISAGSGNPSPPPPPSTLTSSGTAQSAPTSDAGVAATSEATGENTGEYNFPHDAAGTVFDPARHTGSTVKSGLWRMKAGLPRDPGEGEDSPSYVAPGGTATPPPPPAAAAQSAQAAPADEDDEFAAFATAAAAPAAAQPARSWTDADISKLCNQAAVADGGPARVQALITKYIPEGQTNHSRNVPAAQRETFAQDVENTIKIEYAA